MKKTFLDKILNSSIVDTRKYRYCYTTRYLPDRVVLLIQRLPIEKLGTTEAIDGWEIVKVFDIDALKAAQYN